MPPPPIAADLRPCAGGSAVRTALLACRAAVLQCVETRSHNNRQSNHRERKNGFIIRQSSLFWTFRRSEVITATAARHTTTLEVPFIIHDRQKNRFLSFAARAIHGTSQSRRFSCGRPHMPTYTRTRTHTHTADRQLYAATSEYKVSDSGGAKRAAMRAIAHPRRGP